MNPISRTKGRSAAGVAAYISASQGLDSWTNTAFDYRRKTPPVAVGFFNSDHSTSAAFGAALDAGENRGNSCVAREVVVALPASCSADDRLLLIGQITEQIARRWDVPVLWAVHSPDKKGNQKNHHAHLVFGTRDRAGKKTRVLDNLLTTGPEETTWLREMVAEKIQAMVPVAERGCWDARSLMDRGIDRPATKHEGPMVRGLRRQGVLLADAKFNDQVRALENEINQNTELLNEYSRLESAAKADAERQRVAKDNAEHAAEAERQLVAAALAAADAACRRATAGVVATRLDEQRTGPGESGSSPGNGILTRVRACRDRVRACLARRRANRAETSIVGQAIGDPRRGDGAGRNERQGTAESAPQHQWRRKVDRNFDANSDHGTPVADTAAPSSPKVDGKIGLWERATTAVLHLAGLKTQAEQEAQQAKISRTLASFHALQREMSKQAEVVQPSVPEKMQADSVSISEPIPGHVKEVPYDVNKHSQPLPEDPKTSGSGQNHHRRR